VPQKNYITKAGWKRLVEELTQLATVERPKVVREVSDAAAEGDRSENAEYIYRKKQLREIDSRIHFLKGRLEDVVVVDSTPDDPSRVFFGAWVRLEDEDGNITQYRIVGPDEFDPDRNYISMDSPVARALMKRAEGDEVLIKRPKGDHLFTIVKVAYEPFSPA
jgi:transcription elongation factor GreB